MVNIDKELNSIMKEPLGKNVIQSIHVGIVEKCDGKTITVIEGNKSNKVGRRTLAVNGKYIRGFGVPAYTTQSASTV